MNPIRFTATTDWADAMSGYPDSVRLEVYDAIFEFIKTNATPTNLSPMAAGSFAFIKQDLKAQAERLAEISRKRSEAGNASAQAKRGRPRKSE